MAEETKREFAPGDVVHHRLGNIPMIVLIAHGEGRITCRYATTTHEFKDSVFFEYELADPNERESADFFIL